MEEEIWKDIKNYENKYQISSLGRIKSLNFKNRYSTTYREKFLRSTDNGNGYKIVGLCKNNKRINYYVHRLVAEAFVKRETGEKYVNHLDYNISNNNVDNLEWCTQKENINYSKIHKPLFHKSKTNCGERYIYKRKNRYEVNIKKKFLCSTSNLNDAIYYRDIAIEKILNNQNNFLSK